MASVSGEAVFGALWLIVWCASLAEGRQWANWRGPGMRLLRNEGGDSRVAGEGER